MDVPDHPERLREVGTAGERREQSVVLATSKDPLERIHAEQSCRAVENGQVGSERHGRVEQIERHPAGAREPARVAKQSVGHVDHRRRAGVGGRRPGSEDRPGPSVGVHDVQVRPRVPGLQERHPRCRAALDPREREDVPRLRAGPQDRAPTCQVAVDRDGDDDLVTGRQVPADDGDAGRRTGRGHSAGESGHPPHGKVGGQHETHDQGGGAGSHRGDVGEVLHRRAPPDIRRTRPVATEVTVLDEDVERDDDATVGRGQHGGVIAGTEEGLRSGGQQREDPGQQIVLGQVRHCCLLVVHGHTLPRSGSRAARDSVVRCLRPVLTAARGGTGNGGATRRSAPRRRP